MAKKMQVLIAASEVRPLAQTGGLADVTGSLPLALTRQGVGAAVIMPAYGDVLQNKAYNFTEVAPPFMISHGSEGVSATLLCAEFAPMVKLYLIRCDRFFDRPGLYGYEGIEHSDNPERFSFFCKAVIKALPHLSDYPDIILANDWQTGLLMPLLHQAEIKRPNGVFVIHNQGYLGLVPPEKKDFLGLPPAYHYLDGVEYFGQSSLLKAGIVYSQAVVTVSPTYAQEVQSPEYGHGLDGAMRYYGHKLSGILNGVDYDVWNPATDKLIAANYDIDDLSGKDKCKQDIYKHFGLAPDNPCPLVGMVGRLTAQKGFNLLFDAAEDLFRLNINLVVLGSGEPFYEDMARDLAQRFPTQCKIFLGYNNALAH
ncbi:MAG: glycogen synthase, partial [Candidatus Adiutrix sp.]